MAFLTVMKEGSWILVEELAFEEGYEKYGKNWKDVARVVKTRKIDQIRMYADRYFKR